MYYYSNTCTKEVRRNTSSRTTSIDHPVMSIKWMFISHPAVHTCTCHREGLKINSQYRERVQEKKWVSSKSWRLQSSSSCATMSKCTTMKTLFKTKTVRGDKSFGRPINLNSLGQSHSWSCMRSHFMTSPQARSFTAL